MKTLADVIERSINEHLCGGRLPDRRYIYSCSAVVMVCAMDDFSINRADFFLESLGCDAHNGALFEEFDDGPQRQYARALWLTWAAMIAREEGI